MLFLPAVAEHYGVSCVPAGGGLTSLKMKALQTPHNIFSRTEPCGENPIVDYHCAKPYRFRIAYHGIFVPVCNTWQVRELVQVHMKASLILLAALARIWKDVFKDVALGEDCWQEYKEKNQGARGSSHVCMIVLAGVASGR